jgi:hypothetical protein
MCLSSSSVLCVLSNSCFKYLASILLFNANVYQIVERYNIPENCPYLRPPAVQHDIFKAINAQQRSYDNFMQSVYIQLGIAMVPLIRSCTFFEKSITIDNEFVYQLLKDSILLLCNLFLDISIKRRHNLRVHLPKHQRWFFKEGTRPYQWHHSYTQLYV